MTNKIDYSQVAKRQCENTARIYYAFRKKGGTPNDLIEIPAMKRLIGNVKGKKLLDAGCGFGSYSIYCARKGAAVTAVDISETMIQIAKQEAAKVDARIDFRVQDATCLEGIPSGIFDIVISSITVCFNIPLYFKEIARVLKPMGTFCFSEVHPILGGGRKVGEGKDSVWLLDHYFDRGIRKGENVFGKLKPSDKDYQWQWEHYTLEDYCVALRQAGFLIETLLEPEPNPTTRSLNPQKYDSACNYPMFVLIRAVKRP